MAESVPLPAPIPDADSAPFWEAARTHRLVAQRCEACGGWRWPPAGVCPHCRKRGGAWTELRGCGTVTSFVVAHRALHPAFAAKTPYTIVFVAPDEAPNDVLLIGNLLEHPWEQVRVGMAVEVAFEDLPGGEALPNFRAAGTP